MPRFGWARGVQALAASMSTLALLAGPAATQPAAAPPAPDADVSQLVIIAHPPGPALWSVQHGQSTVVILGAVSPVPHRLIWDRSRVEAALDGADLLLTAPKPDLGPLQVLGLLTQNLWKVRQLHDLEPSLPAPLRARFVAARDNARQPASRYAHWKPAEAGFLLLSDFRRSVGLSEAKPGSTVEHMAKARGIRQEPIITLPVGRLTQIAGALDPQQNLQCLSDTLDEIGYEGDHRHDIDDDWARGDILAVNARYRATALERCLMRAPGAARLVQQEMDRATDRLWAQLQKPGKAVAVVDLAWLLPAGGVLDRLKARGAEITVPPALAPHATEDAAGD